MRRRRPFVPPKVVEVIRHLPPAVKRAVKAAIRALGENPSAGEPLQRELAGYRKFRVHRYRVIYRVRGNAVRIFAVGQRRTIYEEVAELLRSEE